MSQDRDLAADRVAAALTTQRLGRDYLFLPSCGSTSDEVAERAAKGAPEGLLVATDAQSKGRGRRGRQWHSPAGENLYFSLLLRPALPPQKIAPLTLLAGAALAESLAKLGFSPRLKWPNDLLMGTPDGLRKVAGILAEASTEGGCIRHVTLGIGINVNTRTFPADLASRATSLATLRGATVARLQVLTSFLYELELLYDAFVAGGPGAALAGWRRFALLGQPCWVQSGERRLHGVAEEVDESGALLMRTSDGELLPVHAGEINWPDRP